MTIKPAKRDAIFGNVTAIPPGLFTFCRAEGSKKCIEIGVVVVVPVELAVLAQFQPGILDRRQFVRVWKSMCNDE